MTSVILDPQLTRSYLLQAEDECFGTLDLIDLPGSAHGLFNDVTIVIVVLNKGENTWQQCQLCQVSLFTKVHESPSAQAFSNKTNKNIWKNKRFQLKVFHEGSDIN